MIIQTLSEQGTTWIAFQIENQAQNHIVGLRSFSATTSLKHNVLWTILFIYFLILPKCHAFTTYKSYNLLYRLLERF